MPVRALMKLAFSSIAPIWWLAGAFGLLGAGIAAPQAVEAARPEPTADQAAFFEAKVRPVLVANCDRCHGANVQMAGLRVDSLGAMLKGGDSGAAIVPGDPDKSLLIRAIRQTGALKMPKGSPLKAEEVSNLEAWVKMGAPWPKGGSQAKAAKPLWSLEPVKKPALPKVRNAAWIRNPLDAFVLAKLEAKGLRPSPEADRRTLIRRLSYDLVGLPPTAEEVDAFVADRAPDAYDKLVDRLLASPHYGERWGRHWLDVARYADTKGYVFDEDRNYPNAYTYRDWVIQAFNRDLPYDKFIVEQLAADRLPEVKDGVDRGPLAAMGFLTVGRRFLNSTPDIIDDRIDVTMRGFQAFTVACARCHDHKFDPIPTQDYYSLYAVFNSSEEASVPISDRPIREPWERNHGQLTAAETARRDLLLTQVARLRKPETMGSLSDDVKGVLQSMREGAVPEGGNLSRLLPAFEPSAQARISSLDREIDDLRRHAPPSPEFAMAMADRAHPGDGVVFRRGNPGNPGPPAPRRFLAALSKPGVERTHWTEGSGRLELAEAIASRQNPLTARVFVNRVWMHHFGLGIVRTPSDFGHQGEPPTDPALLDYLASAFMENGWSIKRLQRMIVTSATYRQSAGASPAVLAADPENRAWSRMGRQRLDLEQMRDAMMAAAGKLDVSQVGGRSVDLWRAPFVPRRAVYGFVERQNLPFIFKAFDFASPDSTSARRFQTTVPQQALFFMNSPFALEMAKGIAARPEIAGVKDDGQRVRELYRLLFQRLPSKTEESVGASYLREASPKEGQASRLVLYAQALMMTNEFLFVD